MDFSARNRHISSFFGALITFAVVLGLNERPLLAMTFAVTIYLIITAIWLIVSFKERAKAIEREDELVKTNGPKRVPMSENFPR